ncbi:SusD/RagB family nutrient-binding outer membrane lipoprotein [Flavobacterium sp. T12S277]|uniref:SusD/RagB family nutrient-binding outer membrane lipoprotein n=1 Tax=Flavobacterium sp. T12S277 TaxID=3402752 RepID=UPI003AD90631
MRKIKYIMVLMVVLISCSDNITDLNEDIINPKTTKPEYLFTKAEKDLVDQMVHPGIYNNVFRLFAQQFSETSWILESQYNISFGKIPDVHFGILYSNVLGNLKQSSNLLENEKPISASEIAVLNNKKAVLDIIIAYTFSQLVDTFGNIPYSEALSIKSHPMPKYDSGQVIYKDLIDKLTKASKAIKVSEPTFGQADLIYNGDALKWKKFANSLKLRLALNMSDVDPVYAAEQAKSAIQEGVITSNSDNFSLNYLSLPPNASPLFLLSTSSYKDYFIPSKILVDKMNSLIDPRRAEYFTVGPDGKNYEGGIYGEVNLFSNYSHINSSLFTPTFPGTLFDYSETEFLLAEAAARSFISDDPETHYSQAIKASMKNWGVSDADSEAYLLNPDVAYKTAKGTWKQKIGEQAWIALYNRGFEAWTSYRRLDFPILFPPSQTYNNLGTIPKRYSYPGIEETLNSKNVEEAIKAIGGNSMSVKVFWDKN